MAGERSDKAIVDNWVRRRMVKGDGRPGRGRATAEEDDDEYNSRMEFPPDDFIAAFERQQVNKTRGIISVLLGQHARLTNLQIWPRLLTVVIWDMGAD